MEKIHQLPQIEAKFLKYGGRKTGAQIPGNVSNTAHGQHELTGFAGRKTGELRHSIHRRAPERSRRPRPPDDVLRTPARQVHLRGVVSMLRLLSTRRRKAQNSLKPKPDPLIRFRRAAKTVQVLLKATALGRQNQQQTQAKYLSWTQFQDDDAATKRAYELFGLTFDPGIFRARREAQISNDAKAVLSLDPRDRTSDQLHVALVSLNQIVEAFGEFPIKMQESLVRVGWYEQFEAKRVIIRQGHTAANFYFILSGTAVVTILETNKKTEEQYVRTAAILRKGNSFGELALMRGARRSATVTCKDTVDLLAVGREDFINIFMHVEKGVEPELIRFLRTVEKLHEWPVHRLPYNDPKVCLFTFFRRGVLLCRDSNSSEWIYVIKTGSCRVIAALNATKPTLRGLLDPRPEQRPKGLSLVSPCSLQSPVRRDKLNQGSLNAPEVSLRKLPSIRTRDQKRMEEDMEKHLGTIEEKCGENPTKKNNEQKSPSSPGLNAPKKRKQKKVFVQIQKLGPQAVFGLENVVLSMMGTTTGTSLVSHGAECVLINRKFFVQHLTDDTAKKIRHSIQPLPSEESLQQKLQDQTNWEAYKSVTIQKCLLQQKMGQDLLNF